MTIEKQDIRVYVPVPVEVYAEFMALAKATAGVDYYNSFAHAERCDCCGWRVWLHLGRARRRVAKALEHLRVLGVIGEREGRPE